MHQPLSLPTAWERAIANELTAHLRAGWRRHTAKRAWHPTGAPRTSGRETSSAFQSALNNTETISSETYLQFLVEADRPFGVPPLAVQITRHDHDRALAIFPAAALQDLEHVVKRGMRPFVRGYDHKGRPKLKRESRTCPRPAADALIAIARAATIEQLDPRDVGDSYAEDDSINMLKVMNELGIHDEKLLAKLIGKPGRT